MADGSLERLLVVQDLDTLITQLEHRKVALAERVGLTGVMTDLAALARTGAELSARRNELMTAQKALETQIASTNDRRSGIEQRMYAARGSSTRDLQAMDEEVRHLTQRRSELEDEELVIMVDQEPVDAALSELQEREGPLQEQAQILRAEVAESQAGIDGELVAARQQRASEAALLPPALSDRYEMLRSRLKGTGAARLIGHRCDGCHLELSPVEVERIRAATVDAVVTCDQCGRILIPT